MPPRLSLSITAPLARHEGQGLVCCLAAPSPWGGKRGSRSRLSLGILLPIRRIPYAKRSASPPRPCRSGHPACRKKACRPIIKCNKPRSCPAASPLEPARLARRGEWSWLTARNAAERSRRAPRSARPAEPRRARRYRHLHHPQAPPRRLPPRRKRRVHHLPTRSTRRWRRRPTCPAWCRLRLRGRKCLRAGRRR